MVPCEDYDAGGMTRDHHAEAPRLEVKTRWANNSGQWMNKDHQWTLQTLPAFRRVDDHPRARGQGLGADRPADRVLGEIRIDQL